MDVLPAQTIPRKKAHAPPTTKQASCVCVCVCVIVVLQMQTSCQLIVHYMRNDKAKSCRILYIEDVNSSSLYTTGFVLGVKSLGKAHFPAIHTTEFANSSVTL